jgi:hypothetical protein
MSLFAMSSRIGARRLLRVVRTTLAALPVVLLAGVAQAGTLNFDFSVTNTIGNVPGTFTGEIFGLTDNATSAASSVVILSIPSGMNNVVSPPIDATLWNQQLENSFTVVNGEVVDGGFVAKQTINGFNSGYQLWINGDNAGKFNENFLNLDGTDKRYVWGNDGLAAANIVPAGSSVPEPAGYLLTIMGAVWAAGYAWSRKGTGASA